jgi:hypothetical protein
LSTSDLIILTDADYRHLRRDLKEAGLDLCYMAQADRPVRLKWSPDLFQRADFLQHLAQRRPSDPSYRVASVSLLKKATWFQPDQFAITFHAVGDLHDADLDKYLAEHNVQSSVETSRDMLAARTA